MCEILLTVRLVPLSILYSCEGSVSRDGGNYSAVGALICRDVVARASDDRRSRGILVSVENRKLSIWFVPLSPSSSIALLAG